MNLLFRMILVIMLLITHAAIAAVPKCETLAGADAQKLIQFLKEAQTAGSDPHCIEYALRHLGDAKVREAIPILATYLSFQRPETDMEKMGMGGALGTIGNDFPATLALAQIGRPALPALIRVVESESNATQSYQNSVYTIMRIFQNRAVGIEFLTHRAAAAKSTIAQSHLFSAAREAVNWCAPSERSACESAAAAASQ